MTLRTILRPARSFRLFQRTSIPQRRWASSAVGPGLTTQFYKTFTRPVAKCLLLAMFTYQLAYYAWVKLETNEIRAEREEIAGLEAQVEELQNKPVTKP